MVKKKFDMYLDATIGFICPNCDSEISVRDAKQWIDDYKEEGRVEGAIGQLKEEVDFLRRFVDGYVYLDEVHQRYLDKIKCLKELESKGVN